MNDSITTIKELYEKYMELAHKSVFEEVEIPPEVIEQQTTED